jgi:hypothetical protein
VLPLRPLISTSFLVTLAGLAPLALSAPPRRLICYDPEANGLTDIR